MRDHSSRGRRSLASACASIFLVVAALLAATDVSAQPVLEPGAAVYAKYCASCHDQVGARIPARDALAQMSPARILRTLDFGLMMSIAYPIKRPDREAVAAFLGKGRDDAAPPPSAFCSKDTRIMSGEARASWPGWGPSPDNARYQTAERAGLDAAQVARLELKWAYGFGGDIVAFGAPTVVNGTLFVGSAGGAVQALDAATGCLHWLYQANGPVRAAPTMAEEGADKTLLFSDQNGGVYAVNAATGKLRWQTRVEEHEATRLTGSFAVYRDLAFVPAASWEETRSNDPAYQCCTFRGSVTAVRVRDGSVAWKAYLVDTPRATGRTAAGTPTHGPSGAGVWATPTVDERRNLLYITTGDNYSKPATATSDAVVALDLATGRVAWSQQTTPNDVWNGACNSGGPNCPDGSGPDHDFGSSAMLLRAPNGSDVLVAGQKSGVVYALDPANGGKLLWQARVGKGGTNGGVQWGMASDGRNVYAAVSDVVRLQNVSGAVPVGSAQLDPKEGGGLTALDLATGRRVWFAPSTPCAPPRLGCSPAQPAAVTAIPDAVFTGSVDGHLRAFSTADGKLVWDFDTARDYRTVNGVAGKGGSLDGAGPVIVAGMVFVNSGYPRFGGLPGNVLLAFGVPGK
ncbi:MAG TPA: PQQ-binding-like beta-propeller repeat protein [Gammaproteobacteria bacterium]|nr:PQQ-binding-like beta-propeller repeat protein [Gammaproteobacteria bacterium]